MTDKPDLTRIWGEGAPSGNVVDPDTTTPGKFSNGWQAEVPPFEHFNFIQKFQTQGLAHINEQGIAVWDDVTTYPVGGLAKGSDGNVYKALVSQSDNDPVSDNGTNWVDELNNRVIRVTSIAEMEAYSAPVGYVFSLNDGGRSGTFDVVAGDFSTELAADTLNGIYVGLADNATATTKVLKRRYSGAVNVTWFGTVGNGTADDTASLQAAIKSTEGSDFYLYLPVGIYRTTEEIAITRGIKIVGAGWEAYKERNNSEGSENIKGTGSFLYTDTFKGIQFRITAQSSVTFEDIAFDQLQPAPFVGWTPTEYNWRIFTGACELLFIKNVLMLKVTKGIRVDNSVSGAEKMAIDGLYAQNLGTLVDIDFQSDVNRINNLHAWPFWSLDQSGVRAYTIQNSTAILSGRNDNPLWSNIFTISQFRSISFKISETSNGTLRSNKVHLSNSDLDKGHTGIYLAGGVNGVTFQGSNLTIQCDKTLSNSRGVNLEGINARFYFSNLRVSKTNKESIRIGNASNRVFVDSAEFEDWGSDTSSPAIVVDAGNFLTMGGLYYFIAGDSPTKILGSGDVKIFGGGVGKIGKSSVVQTVESGASEDIIFQTNILDSPDLNINLSDNTITPELPGTYLCRASITVNSAADGDFVQVRIERSGLLQVSKISRFVGANKQTIVCEGFVEVNGTTDSLGVSFQQNSGGDITLSGDENGTFFEVNRVS